MTTREIHHWGLTRLAAPGPLALRVVRALPGLLALLLAACAPSGSEPTNRWTLAEPPSANYRVFFLEPPWRLITSEGDQLRIRIRSSLDRFVDQSTILPGRFELQTSTLPGVPVVRANAERSQAIGRGETITVEPREITTRADVVGIELLSEETLPEPRFYRYVFLPIASNRVLRLAFGGAPIVDTREIEAMIELVDVGPAP